MLNKVARLLLVVAFSLGLVGPVWADGAVTGSVTASNAAPTITSVTLQAAGGGAGVDSMDPLTEYTVEIVAADNNTIDDITQIDIVIFYDSNGGDDGDGAAALTTGFDCDEIAVYKWLKSGDAWSLENGAVTTTWVISGTCGTPPSMSVTEGEWNLNFTPGKLAREATGGAGTEPEWCVYVKVTDATVATAASTIYNKAMTAYSAITMDPATISFGDLALGGTAAIQTPVDHIITTKVIANDAHAVGVKSAATWTTGTDTITLDPVAPDAAGEFGLKIDDAGDASGHPSVGVAVTTANVTIDGHATDARTSTAPAADEGTSDVDLYMDLTLFSSGIDIGTYSGTITFEVTNS